MWPVLAKQLQFCPRERYVYFMHRYFSPKSFFRLALAAGFAVVVSAAAARWWINSDTNEAIHKNIENIPKRKVGLVLGCARNMYFYSRIEAARQLFTADKIDFILVSGDNHKATYDEAGAMKQALINSGIPPERIVCDYAGFSTLDSIIRAKRVFGVDELTIISQEFHVRRALFIANRRQVDAIGYCAVDVETSIGTRTSLREVFARVKTIMDIYLLHRQPVFLGEPVNIGSESSGPSSFPADKA
jgi:SanA protein